MLSGSRLHIMVGKCPKWRGDWGSAVRLCIESSIPLASIRNRLPLKMLLQGNIGRKIDAKERERCDGPVALSGNFRFPDTGRAVWSFQ